MSNAGTDDRDDWFEILAAETLRRENLAHLFTLTFRAHGNVPFLLEPQSLVLFPTPRMRITAGERWAPMTPVTTANVVTDPSMPP